MNTPKYWITTISKDHIQNGVSGGFIQINHGNQAPLKRKKKDDYLIGYSSKISMEEKKNVKLLHP